jgi:hypothetical protein
MNQWEYLRVALHHRENGKIDYVARRERALPSIATHEEMRGHFNVEPNEWDAYLQKLQSERWDLEQVDKQADGQNETYYFKRAKV